jgi:hypothetical protein
MKTLTAILFFLLLLANPAFATITQISQATAGAVSAATATTGAISTVGASLIVIATTTGQGAATPTITDSVGGNNNNGCYTAINAFNNSTGSNRITLWYCNNPIHTGASHTFTSNGASDFPSIAVMVFSGTLTSSTPLDQTNGTNTSGTMTSVQPGSVTPGQNNEVLITAIGMATTAATAPTINSSYNTPLTTNFLSGTNYGVSMSYLVQTSASASNPTWTTPSGNIVAMIATFSASGSPATNENVLLSIP